MANSIINNTNIKLFTGSSIANLPVRNWIATIVETINGNIGSYSNGIHTVTTSGPVYFVHLGKYNDNYWSAFIHSYNYNEFYIVSYVNGQYRVMYVGG